MLLITLGLWNESEIQQPHGKPGLRGQVEGAFAHVADEVPILTAVC